ncbi:MAG TPA: RIP metalloprotease RseP [Alphaproteobacteria bacterium]|nr:RIP metalloprotease RseP [Alphaproteobacteria bacterium]
MHPLVGILHFAIPSLIALTVLVFVHEMGHFWVARRNKVRVEVFSIGFGPELFGWTDKHNTRWKFSALPLGGYVKMFGDANAASAPDEMLAAMTPEERAVSFHHKKLSQRTAVVFAGPLANIIFTFVVLTALFATAGQPFTRPIVGGVLADSPAARAGILPGDRIVEINGKEIERFQDIAQTVQFALDEPLKIEILRDSNRITLTLTPEIVEQKDNFGHSYKIGRLGLESTKDSEYVRYTPIVAARRAVEEMSFITVSSAKAIGQMFSGKRPFGEAGGPVRMGEWAAEAASNGTASFLFLLAVLSLNLGLINLLPIPMLDGGHLLFYAVEAVRRRPLAPRIQDYGFRIGLTLVLLLMIFVIWNDVT